MLFLIIEHSFLWMIYIAYCEIEICFRQIRWSEIGYIKCFSSPSDAFVYEPQYWWWKGNFSDGFMGKHTSLIEMCVELAGSSMATQNGRFKINNWFSEVGSRILGKHTDIKCINRSNIFFLDFICGERYWYFRWSRVLKWLFTSL